MSSGKCHLILIKADYKYPLEMSLCIYRDSHTKTPSHQIFLCKRYLTGKLMQVTLRANGACKTQRTKLRVWSNAHKSLRKSLTKFAFKWFRATPDNSVSHTVCVHTGPDNWKTQSNISSYLQGPVAEERKATDWGLQKENK